MAYIGQADIANVIDSVNLIAMTDDWAQGTVNTTVLNNILQLASDSADALVSSIYDVPFTSPVPVKIYNASIIFAAEMLYQRRLQPQESNPMKGQADFWRAELMKVNEGQLSLDGQFRRSVKPIITKTTRTRVNTNFF